MARQRAEAPQKKNHNVLIVNFLLPTNVQFIIIVFKTEFYCLLVTCDEMTSVLDYIFLFLSYIFYDTRPSTYPPSSQGIPEGGGGMETTRKKRQIEVTENSLLFVVDSRMFHHSTQTSCPLPWYSRKIRVDKVFSSFLITRCQNSKSGLYRLTSGSQLIG